MGAILSTGAEFGVADNAVFRGSWIMEKFPTTDVVLTDRL